MLRNTLSALLVVTVCLPATAGELKILPNDIVLTGAGASQRIVVVEQTGGQVTADLTSQATLSSSAATVAKVDGSQVKALGDGEAILTARVDDRIATAKIKVQRSKEEIAGSFRNHVIPILTRNSCNSGACHGALAGKGGLKLSLRGYDPETDFFVLTRQAQGRRVDRQEPAKSLLLRKPTMALNHGGGQKLTVDSTDYRILADWIVDGAPGPRDKDRRVIRLDIFPASAVLKPQDRLQMLVRACYDDSTSEDVTGWARFTSTEELVAAVDEAGQVQVAGHGETAVTVWYSNQVGITRILSPLPNKIEAKTYRDAARHNKIDALVLQKLESLHIAPAALCSDHEFIRRAYLDCLGILPTPEEVKKFVTDKEKTKREKLVEEVLKRPEFVDYWSHKWSDLLLVSTRKLPQPGVWAFHQYIRQSVADNVPWDRFARNLLTAQGSTLKNGAGNYFALHRDVSELTEATAVTFLGTSITCARCHNHPLEKWTQDQYWMMANLFARVGLKNGDRAGEVLVQAQSEGDVLHPRRGVAMPPTPLDGKELALQSKTDRRQHFADWLTARNNPFFARAIVNRVWRNFLGRGLVEAEDDLRQTNPPTNAELFDWLAQDFVENGHDMRRLIGLVMNSATYQRSSIPTAENATDDRFFSRYLVRRLSAEVILDAYSQVTGVATVWNQVQVGSTGGTTPTSLYPPGTRALQLPDSQLVSSFLDAFGRPERTQTCACERQQDSSVGQALHLNNGKTLNDKLRSKDSIVDKWVKDKMDDNEAVTKTYLLALCREPTAAERKKFLALLAEAAQDGGTTRREALEDLLWAVLTSKEFVFNR